MNVLNAPTELNILFFLCLIFTIFNFFPTSSAVNTTSWFNIACLTILSLMGITFAFKNIIRMNSTLSMKYIIMYVLLPFSSVVIIPILMQITNNKYSSYYKETKNRISAIDVINAISVVLLYVQLFILYSLYNDFIINQPINLIKPALLFMLLILNGSLNIYNNVIVQKFLTNG